MVPALLASGCYVSDEAQYSGGVAVAADGNADLVEVSPGVEVVADYGLPIFFADDYYWWLDGGIWYQSTWYGGGWARARYVPPHVAGIGHPERYVHYRPAGYLRGGANRVEARGAVAIRSRPAPRGGSHRR